MLNKHASEMVAAGRYYEAISILEKHISTSPTITEEEIILYARALTALSRYDEAFNVLNLAMTGREKKARALGLQAEILWIQHRYEEAHNLCIQSLGRNLFNGRVATVRNRCQAVFDNAMCQKLEADSKGRRFGHAAFYVAPGGNFGDLALPPTIRCTVEHWKEVAEWHSFHVHQSFGAEQVAQINALDGLVVGGGGLFLPDTSPNGNSGWQWNITNDCLNKIDVPIYVIAVGYNLFEGQKFFGNHFQKSLTTLAERASVIGLRNSGSIERVRSFLPESLHEKVRYMPCPTTVISRLDYDGLSEVYIGKTINRVFLNAAFDRSERRFGDTYETFLDHIAKYVSALKSDGISVELAAHLPRDEKLGKDLYEHYGIRLPVHGFYDMSCEDGYNLYREAGLVVGMRGHATMIPFGLGVPVLSIVSHPKMQFFLDDIERPGWGVHAGDSDLFGKLYDKTLDILSRNAEVRSDINSLQEKIYGYCKRTISMLI